MPGPTTCLQVQPQGSVTCHFPCHKAMEDFLQVLTCWQCHWCCGSPAAWTRRKNPGFSRALGLSWCHLPCSAGHKCREKAGAAPSEVSCLIHLGEHFSSQLLDRVISAGKSHIALLPFFPGPKHLLIGGIPVYSRKLEQKDLSGSFQSKLLSDSMEAAHVQASF